MGNINPHCNWPTCGCLTEAGDPCRFENPDFYIRRAEEAVIASARTPPLSPDNPIIRVEKEDLLDRIERMDRGEFQIGDHVEKHTGDYRLSGHVVAAFDTSLGKRRFVVEHANGILHIYGPANLRPVRHDGLSDIQRRGMGWMVVGTDNFARETVADFVVATNIRSQETAKSIAQRLNGDEGENGRTHYVARPHDAALCAGMFDFV